GSFDDLDLDPSEDFGELVGKDRSLIGAVGKQFFKIGEPAKQRRQQQNAAVAVLNGGRMNGSLHQQPLGVDENMTLLALDVFSSVEAVRINRGPAFFSALHALAVDDGGGRAGVAAGLRATLLVEPVMDTIQCAVQAPVAEITIHRAARRKILRQIAPLASRTQQVQDGVERLPHVRLAFAASPPRRRNERLDKRPLLIRQVARISQMITLVPGSILVRPHRRPYKTIRRPGITTDS